MLFTLALRNLRRRRTRTVVVAVGIVVSVTAVTIQAGLVAGVRHQMIDRLLVNQFGHATVFPGQAQQTAGGTMLIHDSAEVEQAVRGVLPGARTWGSLSTMGMAFGDRGSSGRVAVWGVAVSDPLLIGFQRDPTVSDLPPGTILLGAAVASGVDASSGDIVSLSVVDASGNLNAGDFRVTGILTNAAPWQDYFALIPLSDLQSLMGVPSAVSMLKIYLETGESAADSVVDAVNDALTGAGLHDVARPYHEAGRLYMGILAASRVQSQILGFVLLLAAALGVGSLQILNVHDRRSEIGTMRALGTPRGAVWRMIVLEGGLLALGAGLIGVVVGVVLTLVLGATGIETGIEAFRWMTGGTVLTPRVDFGALVLVMLELLGVVTLSGLYPAWRAAGLAPTTAMVEAAT